MKYPPLRRGTRERNAVPLVNYVEAARRHQSDSQVLEANGRSANAGQLLGFSMECGLKALLIASGVTVDTEGSVARGFRKHLPELDDQFTLLGHLIPDSRQANRYLAMIPGRANFKNNWSTDHRYWGDSALVVPLGDLPHWITAVDEVNQMLDQAIADGVLP